MEASNTFRSKRIITSLMRATCQGQSPCLQIHINIYDIWYTNLFLYLMTLCNVYSEFLGKIVPPSSLQMSRTNKIINRMFLKNTKYKTQNTIRLLTRCSWKIQNAKHVVYYEYQQCVPEKVTVPFVSFIIQANTSHNSICSILNAWFMIFWYSSWLSYKMQITKTK